MTRCLHGVRMEQHALFMAHGGNFRNGHYGTHFVIGEHYAYKNGFICDGVAHLLRCDKAVLINGQVGHLYALFLKRGAAMQYCVMLHIGGDYMVALLGISFRNAEKHGIVALRAAAGEYYFARVGIYGAGHLLARMLDAYAGGLAEGVRA